MGFIQCQSLDVSEIVTETSTEPSSVLLDEDNDREETEVEHKMEDIFSADSSNIGKAPLLEMEIDTGDSPPITQKPYMLSLKHVAWVQKELEILEKAGVIVRSVSPWTSPIVVVLKRTVLEEPPKRRLCVDYRTVNSLLPPVKKAFLKAKCMLTLVPLPKLMRFMLDLKVLGFIPPLI